MKEEVITKDCSHPLETKLNWKVEKNGQGKHKGTEKRLVGEMDSPKKAYFLNQKV